MKILTVGALIKRKRIHLCRSACHQMFDWDFDWDFEWVVIGSGPEGKTLKINCPSQMTFINRVLLLRPYMESADVFVLPSYDEGFGMVYIESVLCGTPFVCASGEGGVEIVSLVGGGVVVDITGNWPRSAGNIVDAIDYCLSYKLITPTVQAKARSMTDVRKIKQQWQEIGGMVA